MLSSWCHGRGLAGNVFPSQTLSAQPNDTRELWTAWLSHHPFYRRPESFHESALIFSPYSKESKSSSSMNKSTQSITYLQVKTCHGREKVTSGLKEFFFCEIQIGVFLFHAFSCATEDSFHLTRHTWGARIVNQSVNFFSSQTFRLLTCNLDPSQALNNKCHSRIYCINFPWNHINLFFFFLLDPSHDSCWYEVKCLPALMEQSK